MDGFAQLLDEAAHVVASPVADVSESPALLTEELLVWNLLAGCGIRIEIVVDMETIDVVAAHDVGSHTAGIVGCLLESRVEEHQIIIVEAEIRTVFTTLRGDTWLRDVEPCLAR